MQRLTEKTKDCFGYRLKDGSDSEVGFFKNYDAFYSHMMMVRELGEYEDLEEQGLLLRLPCKVGDTVYRISDRLHVKRKYIEKTKISRIAIDEHEIYVFCSCKPNAKRIFGVNVFQTAGEAEAKLREMEAGK